MVVVGGPLAGVGHVLVVVQPGDGVPVLLRADHGHHGVPPLLLLLLRRGRTLGLERSRKSTQRG